METNNTLQLTEPVKNSKRTLICKLDSKKLISDRGEKNGFWNGSVDDPHEDRIQKYKENSSGRIRQESSRITDKNWRWE